MLERPPKTAMSFCWMQAGAAFVVMGIPENYFHSPVAPHSLLGYSLVSPGSLGHYLACEGFAF